MRPKFLLDTHAFLWAATEDDRLGARASRVIATTPYEKLAIADVTLQEIGLLIHAGAIRFEGRPAALLRPLLDYVTVVPITLEIAVSAPALALPHGDQFDRIITATARHHRIPLITKDANISDSGLVDVVW